MDEFQGDGGIEVRYDVAVGTKVPMVVEGFRSNAFSRIVVRNVFQRTQSR